MDPGEEVRSLMGDFMGVSLAVGSDVCPSVVDASTSLLSTEFVETAWGLSEDGLSGPDTRSFGLRCEGRSWELDARGTSTEMTCGGGGGGGGASSVGVGGLDTFVGSGSGNIRGAFTVSAGGGGGSGFGNIGGGGGALRRGGGGGGGKALMRSIPVFDHSSSGSELSGVPNHPPEFDESKGAGRRADAVVGRGGGIDPRRYGAGEPSAPLRGVAGGGMDGMDPRRDPGPPSRLLLFGIGMGGGGGNVLRRTFTLPSNSSSSDDERMMFGNENTTDVSLR